MRKKETGLDLTNHETFSQVFQSTNVHIFRYLCGFTGGTAEEAEDLLADTFIHAWKARGRFRGGQEAVLFWLLRIARNLALDAYRRGKTRSTQNFDDEIDGKLLFIREPGPEETLINNEAREAVWKQFQSLPSDVKEMLILRYFLDWQVKQIATYLGKSETAVSMAIQRAIKRLQHECPENHTSRERMLPDV